MNDVNRTSPLDDEQLLGRPKASQPFTKGTGDGRRPGLSCVALESQRQGFCDIVRSHCCCNCQFSTWSAFPRQESQGSPARGIVWTMRKCVGASYIAFFIFFSFWVFEGPPSCQDSNSLLRRTICAGFAADGEERGYASTYSPALLLVHDLVPFAFSASRLSLLPHKHSFFADDSGTNTAMLKGS